MKETLSLPTRLEKFGSHGTYRLLQTNLYGMHDTEKWSDMTIMLRALLKQSVRCPTDHHDLSEYVPVCVRTRDPVYKVRQAVRLYCVCEHTYQVQEE